MVVGWLVCLCLVVGDRWEREMVCVCLHVCLWEPSIHRPHPPNLHQHQHPPPSHTPKSHSQEGLRLSIEVFDAQDGLRLYSAEGPIKVGIYIYANLCVCGYVCVYV